ncbi:glycosyltransferase family 2 protein [Falsiroseomonas oryzae]|uniref:glycosyltransferase family 2 protein n=1 Tax=Falsiroseomonas oryzae TaxID=2766473 RepID=UPI0022EA3721|nr:glycosyltransferase family 2 protein [Roseomonas sp. MO-31]
MRDDVLEHDRERTTAAACELTILMPCLNEAETLGRCIAKASAFLASRGIAGEILIADNGSTDGSQAIAEAGGARVVPIPTRGYGAALIGGIAAARGRYVIMGDSDDSYDFSNLDAFVAKLREGYALVMGNRFLGGIQPGAMPPLHRYLGNPVLTGIGRLLFRSPVGDFHCGLRGFDRAAMLRLDLRATGMEFASEMVVKATVQRLRITEVPTTLSPDGRSRPPHLRSWRDGWRHLRFLLLFSPRGLFLYPGAAMFALGGLLTAWLLPAPRMVGGVTFDIHTLLYAALLLVVGMHFMLFWVFAKIYGMREGIVPPDPGFTGWLARLQLERVLIAAGILVLAGLALGVVALGLWQAEAFGELHADQTMRLVIPSAVLILLGLQLASGSFFASVLEIRGAPIAAPAGPAARQS